MEQLTLASLLTPAIIFAVVAYLTRFFGKIIEDQNPFSDNVAWAIELRGVLFMVDISIGLIGVLCAIHFPWRLNGWVHLITFLVLSFSVVAIQLSNKYLGSKYFNLWSNNIKVLEGKTMGIIKIFAHADKYISTGLASVILLYIGTIEYLAGNYYFMILYFPTIFLLFVLLANNFSLKRGLRDKITPVDIFFTDSSMPVLEKVVILKYNPDNIRVRSENKILWINKGEVSRIEMTIPDHIL